MGSESIAHEAEGRMGYWLRGHEGENAALNQNAALIIDHKLDFTKTCYLKVVINVFLACLHSSNERESAFPNPGLWNPEYSSRKPESHWLLKSRLRNPWHGMQNPRLSWILLHGVIT